MFAAKLVTAIRKTTSETMSKTRVLKFKVSNPFLVTTLNKRLVTFDFHLGLSSSKEAVSNQFSYHEMSIAISEEPYKAVMCGEQKNTKLFVKMNFRKSFENPFLSYTE